MEYVSNIRKKVGNDAIFLPAVGCGIIQNKKILLQKRADNKKWGIHGGYMNLGENFIETLERETKEELNVKPINPRFVNIYSGEDMHYIYPNNDEVYAILVLYLVEEFEGELKPNCKELIELKWFDIEELPENINECDVKIINDVISLYKKHNN